MRLSTLENARRSLPQKIRDWIRDQISDGELAAGALIPSEAALCARFGVSRATVREALRLLEDDGLVSVHQGVGRFVTPIPALEYSIMRPDSVTAMMEGIGLSVANRVLSVAETKASGEEIEAMNLFEGATIIRLERVRYDGTRPIIYSVDAIRRDAFPADIASCDWSGSLVELLSARGIRINASRAKIHATHLPSAISEHLELDPNEPWLLFVDTMLAEGGQAIVHSHDYYRGQAVTFEVIRQDGR
jgi:GntR family transcriptional regulator